MMRIRGRKPSPAMVVAIVALVFAIGGTSVASVATISALSKKEKKQTRSIAKNEINKAAPGLSVAKANVADGLDGVTYVTTESSVPPRPATGESIATGLAPCPPGTKVVGGGVKLVNELFLGLVDSYPTTSGWAGRVLNANNSSTGTFLTTAICAKATSSSGSPPSS